MAAPSMAMAAPSMGGFPAAPDYASLATPLLALESKSPSMAAQQQVRHAPNIFSHSPATNFFS